MSCRVELCCFGQRLSFVEYVIGGLVVKSLVGTLFVEVAQVVGDPLSGLGHRLVCAPVDLFLLEAAPVALHPYTLSSQWPLPSIARLERVGETAKVNCGP